MSDTTSNAKNEVLGAGQAVANIIGLDWHKLKEDFSQLLDTVVSPVKNPDQLAVQIVNQLISEKNIALSIVGKQQLESLVLTGTWQARKEELRTTSG